MRRIIPLILLLISFSLSARNIYVLSVGVADYPGTKNDLSLPANDARSIQSLYKAHRNSETVILTNSNATRDNIIKCAQSLFSKSTSNDIIVVFFSGHGYPGGLVAYDQELSYEDLRKIMRSSKAHSKMIFADACFSGKIRTDGHNNGSTKDNIMLFLSCRSNETSLERRDMRNGFFTTCLVRCLKGAADVNKDRVVTAKELFTAVSEGVIKLSNNRQHPVMWGNFNDYMTVISWK